MKQVMKMSGFISLCAMFGCAGKSDLSTGDCANSSVDGYQTIVQNDITREYILHVPSGYDGSSSLPLVIAYHGNGGCAEQFAAYEAQLESSADSNGFLLAYPQGVVRAKGAAEWDPGDDGTQDINTNDLAFFDSLLADISSSYNVESSQVYAVGYSNGGMMAYGLACNRGDQVAAVGIMSGVMLPGNCDEGNYTSVIHFHGTADAALPYEGNQDFQAISEVLHQK